MLELSKGGLAGADTSLRLHDAKSFRIEKTSRKGQKPLVTSKMSFSGFQKGESRRKCEGSRGGKWGQNSLQSVDLVGVMPRGRANSRRWL